MEFWNSKKMSCQGDNVCHINALLRHQFPSLLYTDMTYYNMLNVDLKKIIKMTSMSERTQTNELWTICRYFQLVFQNFDTLFIYFRYYLTLNNLTD